MDVHDRRVAIPWGLVGMLLLIAGVEWTVGRHREQFAGDFDFGWRLTAKAIARGEARKSEILCFGDSLMGAGLAPRVLTHRLGLKAYNFAMAGSGPAVSYFMLRQAIESGAKPKAVVVEYKWSYLDDADRDCEHILPVVGGLRDFIDLAWSSRDAAYFGLLALRKYVPSYNHRYEIRNDLLARLRGEALLQRGQLNPILERHITVNQGATMALFHREKPYDGSVDPNSQALFPTRWKRDPVKTDYVERFFSLAEAHQITVFWLLMPNTPAVYSRRIEVGAEHAFNRFVAALQQRHPNVVVIDGRTDSYPPGVFVDATHLNSIGASLLSDDVAAAMEPYVGGKVSQTRWVALPRFRKRTLDVEVEDIAQSHQRFAEQAASARRDTVPETRSR